jgi:hypothetical protein
MFTMVDAALGFVSQRECITAPDAVCLLEAVRDALALTPEGSAVTSIVEHTLSVVSTRATHSRSEVVDTLLDVRQAIARTSGAAASPPRWADPRDASDCAGSSNAEAAAPESTASDRASDRKDTGDERRQVMRASIGDRIVVRSRHVGVPERIGDVVEIRGDDGSPPYLVRWHDNGSVGLFYPGADATIDSNRASGD